MACATDVILEGLVPPAVAIESEAGVTTYGDLALGVDRIASYLCALRHARGERAMLLADNSPFWVAAYLGAMRAGYVAVPVPVNATPLELAQIVTLTDPKIAFVDARALARHGQLLSPLHVVTDQSASATATSFDQLPSLASGRGPFPSIQDDDLAALMLTSGSTAAPRGVMVTHGNIIANTESIIEALQLTKVDRIMTVLPFHYCFGTSLLHTHLRVGGSLVLDSRFMYPEVILDHMERAACTGFAGVPSHFQILLRKSSLRNRSFPSLRYLQQAGGHLAPSLVDELRAALPHVKVFTMYGQTEATARLSYLPPDLLDTKRGSIGKGISGVTLRVTNESGTEVAAGEVGEIVAKGANIAKGYWRAPDASAECFRDGWLHTGDLATIDRDGFIYIVGREKDFIKVRGERTACGQIEAKLLEHDSVLEVAVVGVPDDIFGEAVKAFIVPRTAADPDLARRLRTFYESRIPAHLVPKEIVLVPELPKNAAGKVLKRALGSVGTGQSETQALSASNGPDDR
jgi:acyl-CoA synthetase (AMP-forming)/AMP-acid ligase II